MNDAPTTTTEDAPLPLHLRQWERSAITAASRGHAVPIRNRRQPIGRNAPCECGSGKKRKCCHGQNDNHMKPYCIFEDDAKAKAPETPR